MKRHHGDDEEQIMNILALCGASKGALVPSLAIGVPAGMRADGLDGFAIGALMSGACFLMATSPRRPRRGRPLCARRERAVAAAGAHRSPPRWARTGRPRAEVGRVLPRHAAPQVSLASRMTGLFPSRDHAGGVT